VRVGTRGLSLPALVGVAVAAFVALALFAVPFPVVVALAAVAGWMIGRRVPTLTARKNEIASGTPPLIADDALHAERPSGRRAARILVTGLVLWTVPVALTAVLFGRHSVFVDEGLFFSGAAVVTFGGAYAVLSYVAQQAVNVYGWLSPGEMVQGLGFAETTPGPLIMVVQFVAFLGAYRNPGSLDPWVAAVIGALLTVWVTFVPCFLFVLLGAPYVERLRGNRALSAALMGITAAVVGVIANLALYFGLHTLFAEVTSYQRGPLDVAVPHLDSVRWDAVAVTALACLLLFRARLSVLWTLGACSVAGAALYLLSN
jgi:chromate transporter